MGDPFSAEFFKKQQLSNVLGKLEKSLSSSLWDLAIWASPEIPQQGEPLPMMLVLKPFPSWWKGLAGVCWVYLVNSFSQWITWCVYDPRTDSWLTDSCQCIAEGPSDGLKFAWQGGLHEHGWGFLHSVLLLAGPYFPEKYAALGLQINKHYTHNLFNPLRSLSTVIPGREIVVDIHPVNFAECDSFTDWLMCLSDRKSCV